MTKQHPFIKSTKFTPAPAVETFWLDDRRFGRVLVSEIAGIKIFDRPDLGRVEIMEGEDKGTTFVVPRAQIAAARTAA